MQINGMTLVAQHAASLESQAQWLLNHLRTMHTRGSEMRDGVKIQVGWSILTMKAQERELLICQPDFSHDPFSELTDDITTTLLILAQQRDVLIKVAVEGVPALFYQKVVLAKGSLSAHRVYLERTQTNNPADSGWYIGSVEPSDEPLHYEAIFVYQLLNLRPALLSVLSLPVGYLVVFDWDEIEAILDNSEENVWQS